MYKSQAEGGGLFSTEAGIVYLFVFALIWGMLLIGLATAPLLMKLRALSVTPAKLRKSAELEQTQVWSAVWLQDETFPVVILGDA